MIKLSQEELIADYNAHVDAILRSVANGSMLRAKAELSELILFIERHPGVGLKAWQVRS